MTTSSINTQAALVRSYNHAHSEMPVDSAFDVEECISDLMSYGEAERGDNQPVLTIEAVSAELSENISTEQLAQIFTMAQEHKVFESTKMMRELLKDTARNIIKSDMPKPVKSAA
jgi:hypothetical protein